MSKNQSGLDRALGALAFGDYRRFALSLLFTSLGAQLLQTAILWQVYEITGSALLLGLSGLARAAPHLILSLVGGVVADRVNRVYLVQIGQVMNAVLLLTLAFLSVTHAVVCRHPLSVFSDLIRQHSSRISRSDHPASR